MQQSGGDHHDHDVDGISDDDNYIGENKDNEYGTDNDSIMMMPSLLCGHLSVMSYV